MAGFLLCNIILLLSLWTNILHGSSDDRLKPGEFISYNETIVSDNGIFALGFFSPTNSTTNLYLGIWYHNLPKKRVVWVANRENAVTDSFATFQISNDSNLVIMDSKRSILWSSDLTESGSLVNETAVVLLNTGNLVLRKGTEGDFTVLWQSFDYITDTFLPGMTLGFSLKEHKLHQLVSWRSEIDPSAGNFSFGFHPDTSFQIFTWRGTEKYDRSNPMIGSFYNETQLPSSSSFAYTRVIFTSNEIFFTFNVSEISLRLQINLDHSGKSQLMGWSDYAQDWITYLYHPRYECERYGWCGPNGYCDTSEDMPTCKCLQGFEPKLPGEWEKMNFTAGCARKEVLQCGKSDMFLRLAYMKVPDQFLFMTKNISECEAECRRNCTCTAYAYSNLKLNGTSVPRCLVWMGELLDTESAQELLVGEELYLRLANSDSVHSSGSLRNNSKQRTALLIIIISLATIAAICLGLLWSFRTRIKGICWNRNKGGQNGSDSSISIIPKGFSGSNESSGENPEQQQELQIIKFETLVLATDNFSASNTVGQGGFGIVYKGKLPDGQDIAVKRLARGSTQGLEEYKNEVMLIAKLQHRNLVRLLGWCIQGEEKLLIYEYMQNKSLDYFLFDPTRKSVLDWRKRFNIIKGIARALLYLHQDSRLRIIHRDLKPSNILLDENMEPKVSDFGMARIFTSNQDKANTNRLVGTYGYMSPEYGLQGLFSVKSDVYSFGVLILEIVSGSRNVGSYLIGDFPNLLAYAWKIWTEGKAIELADTSIAKSCLSHEVERCIYVGLLCVQDSPDNRPNMSAVIYMLENEIKAYTTIEQPLFITQRMENLEGHSASDLTNTMVEGR